MSPALQALLRVVRRVAGQPAAPPPVEVPFAGRTFRLEPRWTHERDYLDYIRDGRVNAPIAMDAWVFGTFVRPGARVIDAGANIGFTALLALRAGAAEVHCFEPDPRHLDRLRRLAGGPIVLHEVALADRPGTMTLHLSASHNQGSTLSDRMLAGWPKAYAGGGSVEVELATLDGVFPEGRVDLLKLDIEGAELPALRGAAAMLADPARRPPLVYVELYEEFYPEVRDLLAPHYPHAARVVCAPGGAGRLIGAEEDVAELQRRGALLRPPSFLFSVEPLEQRGAGWTLPGGQPAGDALARA